VLTPTLSRVPQARRLDALVSATEFWRNNVPMNMSYCRFENTLAALRECNEALADIMNLDDLPESEAHAARRLVKLCASIAGDWEHDVLSANAAVQGPARSDGPLGTAC
jgi:hypothetical protein